MDANDAPPPAVTVAIATYRRNDMLERCIASVLSQVDAPAFDIVVVDNDPDRSAAEVVTGVRAVRGGPDITYLPEAEPGISTARNRAVEHASELGRPWLAFIDDDETAATDWLRQLASTADEHRADAVAGSVHAVLEPGGEDWIEPSDFHKPMPASGTRIDVASTANILINVEALDSLGDDGRFDPAFGLTGGSDTMLTARLSVSGATIVAEPRAVVTEVIPAVRQTQAWLRQRRRRQAAGYVAVQRLVLRERFWFVKRLLAAAKHAGEGAVLTITGVATRSTRRRRLGSVSFARAAGTLLGLAHRRVAEYDR